MPSTRGLIEIAPRITDSSADYSTQRLPTRRLSHVHSRIPLLVSVPQDHARVPLSCLAHPAPFVPVYACVSLPSAQRYTRLLRHSSGPTRPPSTLYTRVCPSAPAIFLDPRASYPSIHHTLVTPYHSLTFIIPYQSLISFPIPTTRLLLQTFPN